MLYYWVTAKHAYTIQTLMKGMDGKLDGFLRVIAGQEIRELPTMPPANIIFSDVDRMESYVRNYVILLERFSEAVQKAGGTVQCFNHPARSMRRFNMLRTLYNKGINPFNTYSVWELDQEIRYPVFIRCRHDHDGPRTALLEDRSTLINKLQTAINYDATENLMVVEFVDTADAAGVYRKYSAVMIGQRLIPRHIQFRKEWCVKEGGLENESLIEEELDYVSNPIPHEAAVREVFDIAEIRYGRIDYSILDGRIVVWEINTNPRIVGYPPVTGARKRVLDIILPKMLEGFREIDYQQDQN